MKIFNKKNQKISLRYCKNCKSIKKFRYSHFIFHSECIKCLCRESRQITKEEFDRSVYNEHAWEIEETHKSSSGVKKK